MWEIVVTLRLNQIPTKFFRSIVFTNAINPFVNKVITKVVAINLKTNLNPEVNFEKLILLVAINAIKRMG